MIGLWLDPRWQRRLAGLAAYQAIFLTPILAVYLFDRRSRWRAGWTATLAAPAMLAAWQIWERATSGAMPAAVLAGYMQQLQFTRRSR